MTSSTLAVAGSILEQADRNGMSKKKLHKLAYYTQAWSLALRGEPAFPGRIEAWRDGPVAIELRNATRNQTCGEVLARTRSQNLTTEGDLALVISLVVAEKDTLSEGELIDQTHGESPWLNARGDLKEGESGSQEITHADMERYIFNHGTLFGMSADQLIALGYGRPHDPKPPSSTSYEPATLLDRSANRLFF